MRLFSCFSLVLLSCSVLSGQSTYDHYHQQVIAYEEALVARNFSQAISIIEALDSIYDFTFLREHKIAAQLYVHEGETAQVFRHI